MLQRTLILILGLGLFIMPINALGLMQSANYAIDSDVLSSGGRDDSSSLNYGLQDTIGEAIIQSATSTSANFGTKAGFQEMYSGIFITLDIAAASLELGNLSASSVKTASHTLLVDTNASTGFTATLTGSTLQSGANSITGIGAAAAASNPGNEQFGLNLVANTAPAVGLNPTGSAPLGVPADQYNIPNQFAFNSGDVVATSTVAINATTYTVSYIANIGSGTESGAYSTTLTYSAVINP